VGSWDLILLTKQLEMHEIKPGKMLKMLRMQEINVRKLDGMSGMHVRDVSEDLINQRPQPNG
jgi:hypothetical protein